MLQKTATPPPLKKQRTEWQLEWQLPLSTSTRAEFRVNKNAKGTDWATEDQYISTKCSTKEQVIDLYATQPLSRIFREEAISTNSEHVWRSYFACHPLTYVQRYLKSNGAISAHEHVMHDRPIRLFLDFECKTPQTVSWNAFYQFVQYVKKTINRLLKNCASLSIDSNKDWIELDASDFVSIYSMHLVLHSVYFENRSSLLCMLHIVKHIICISEKDHVTYQLNDGTQLFTGEDVDQLLSNGTLDMAVYDDFKSLRMYYSEKLKEKGNEDRRLVALDRTKAKLLCCTTKYQAMNANDTCIEMLRQMKQRTFDVDILKKSLFHFIEPASNPIIMIRINHEHILSWLMHKSQPSYNIEAHVPTSKKSTVLWQGNARILVSPQRLQLTDFEKLVFSNIIERYHYANIMDPKSAQTSIHELTNQKYFHSWKKSKPEYEYISTKKLGHIYAYADLASNNPFITMQCHGFCSFAQRYHKNNCQTYTIYLQTPSICIYRCYSDKCKKSSHQIGIPVEALCCTLLLKNQLTLATNLSLVPPTVHLDHGLLALFQNEASVTLHFANVQYKTVWHYIASLLLQKDSKLETLSVVHIWDRICKAHAQNQCLISLTEWNNMKLATCLSAVKNKCTRFPCLERLLMSTQGSVIIDPMFHDTSKSSRATLIQQYLVDMGDVCMQYRAELLSKYISKY